eukprot:Gregarina_sp_Poly_1__1298@NODE_1319_length_4396_cov_42_175560_g188_i1_p5_GENE_NODE_1319_length_4396_cov_42_175560_g188_i1NODE_1319_length_4396_cov_42_175560_g188_i1_p5_ORF_typecomplete_len123_score3_93_NODE_1319_length_4396_cov_42_175560_g188_i1151519
MFCGAACTRRRKLVTIPKLPPPAPRSAQNKSLWEEVFASTQFPLDRHTVIASILSDPRPHRRLQKPIPPPSRNPAMPRVGHSPGGNHSSPCSYRYRYRVPMRTPGPTSIARFPLSSSLTSMR